MNNISPDNAIRSFLEAAIVPGDMVLPFKYPRPEQWEEWQSGFRYDGVSGASLVASTPGEWQPGWYVVALNYFDDPFFIDLNEVTQGYPVYYAPHGAGRWDAEHIASSLQEFSNLLAALRDCSEDDEAALSHIRSQPYLQTKFWNEVCENRLAREPAEDTASKPLNPLDWQRGSLVITAIGEQKLKVIQFLKKMLNLPLPQALALAAQPKITVAEGYRIQLRDTEEELQALGATVEFQHDGQPSLKIFRLDTFYAIEDLIDCVKAEVESNTDYAVYSANDDDFCSNASFFIAAGVGIDDHDNEIYPKSVRQRGLQYMCSCGLIQDVVSVAIRQKADASHEEIIQALNHYSKYDNFLELK
ncbi:hypothetical protein SOASR030_35980 [Leminorella grimontii]|uniref:DUF7716 domain-containing protein n=2 Tax=Leminorella grimontii TaxID=82981 RepID=A0AAV5N5W3_9GAMM|nr:hypothetical protein [Leminorella grimontii]KFC93120.1 hypothetical protein GLGR_3511 [Leminorella grimontii ATCC 33999 = DSM 5078]GKX57486.1 hypothetical protein SOASR030_35980 [Leminorella grimontii]